MIDNDKKNCWSRQISHRLETVFLNEKDADVSLKCAKGGSVMCHSFVLSLHSDELRDTLIKSEDKEKESEGENNPKYVIVLEVFGDVKATIVRNVIGSLYSGNLDINLGNNKIIYEFAVQFGIEWMMELVREFFTKTIPVNIDLMKFASLMSQKHSDDFIMSLCQDYLAKSNRFSLKNNIIIAEEHGLIDVSLIISIGRYCTFESDKIKIGFFVNWCEKNRNKTAKFAELILHAIAEKVGLFRHIGSVAILASHLLRMFLDNNLINFCKVAISEKGFARQIMNYLEQSKDHEFLDVSLILAVCDKVDDIDKLKFIVECCRSGSDRSKVGDLANYAFNNVKLELYKYFDDKDDLVITFLDLALVHGPEEIQSEAKKRSDMLYESSILKIGSSRELIQLVSSDKWRRLKIENIFQLFDRFQYDIDSFTLLGAFGEWIKHNNLSKANVQSFLTKFRISSLPLKYTQDFANLCIWPEESHKLFQSPEYLDGSGLFEMFAEVSLPSTDKTDFEQGEEMNTPSMATFKRSAGQFTRGSRIMRIKSSKRGNCIRLGFDTTRTPFIFKYPITSTRKGSISQDSVPLTDVSKDFVTIYGMLKGRFINLPFIHPSVLEDMISTARVENEKFVFVVFTKSNTL